MKLEQLKRNNSFEDYLREIHADGYMGTDDNMPDDFEAWLGNKEQFDILEYAHEWECSLIEKVASVVRENGIDYIEAECEFVKEDVHDGNYGYFKIYPKALEALGNFHGV